MCVTTNPVKIDWAKCDYHDLCHGLVFAGRVCQNNPCLHGGTCISEAGKAVCECPDGFSVSHFVEELNIKHHAHTSASLHTQTSASLHTHTHTSGSVMATHISQCTNTTSEYMLMFGSDQDGVHSLESLQILTSTSQSFLYCCLWGKFSTRQLVGRALDSWSKGCELESQQEWRENFCSTVNSMCWPLFSVLSTPL